MKKIEIVDVEYDGYERLYRIRMNNSNIPMYAHGICHDEYIVSGSKHYDAKVSVYAAFSIQWVMDMKLVGEEIQTCVTQEVENSSHTHCVAQIKKVLSVDSFLCNAVNLGEITVELENQNNQLCEGIYVEFSGNLEIDICSMAS